MDRDLTRAIRDLKGVGTLILIGLCVMVLAECRTHGLLEEIQQTIRHDADAGVK